MNVIPFLRRLRTDIIAITGDANTIVRLDADAQTPDEALLLVIISAGQYLPFKVDADDFYHPDDLMQFCIVRVKWEIHFP